MATMFKKPKRNFRGRRTGDDDEENDPDENSKDSLTVEDVPAKPEILVEPVKKKEKKKKKDKSDGKKAVLSFDHEDDEESGEIFKIKKSSHSRRIAKQLKKESRKEREERLKREEEEAKKDAQKQQQGTENGSSNADMAISDFEDANSEEEEKKPHHKFKAVLERGEIPDAAMIHLARKKRQMAREAGGEDFVPLEDPKTSSRLIREEDHDKSDDEDERISFSVNNQEQERRKMQDTFLAAEHGSDSEGSDHEMRQWEEQQIKKGVSIPQVQTSSSQPAEYDQYQQYMYSQTANIFNPDAPAYSIPPLGGATTSSLASSSSTGGQVGIRKLPSGYPPTELPQVSLEQVQKRLRDRLESLGQVHRAHLHEKDDLDERLDSTEKNIDRMEKDCTKLEEQSKFFQEMRGYVRDLVECLNDKVPKINELEAAVHALQRQRAEKMCKRRQEDIKDQSMDFMSSKAAAGMNLARGGNIVYEDTTKQRRVAEREARRSRRRRARESRNIKDHHDGLSSDEEVSQSDLAKYNVETDRIAGESRVLFEDVMEDFCRVNLIKKRFEEWKFDYGDSYQEAFIGLCLPKLFTPLVRLQLLKWSPLDKESREFEEINWYEALMFYGYREGESIDIMDSDVKILPSMVDKVMLPKCTELVKHVWDPMSASQTNRLVWVLQKLVKYYPTITSEDKNTQALIEAIVKRMRKTLDDDVFIPLYPKNILENKSSGPYVFLQRQFWSCVKLLGNILKLDGFVSKSALQEIALDGLLNRYIMLGLQSSDVNMETIEKCQIIASTFPKQWFTGLPGDTTIPQLENLCRYLVHVSTNLDKTSQNSKDADKKEARDMVKQVTKILVNIHAMNHALSLATMFSLKI